MDRVKGAWTTGGRGKVEGRDKFDDHEGNGMLCYLFYFDNIIFIIYFYYLEANNWMGIIKGKCNQAIRIK